MVYSTVLMVMAIYRTTQFWLATSEAKTGSRLRLKSSRLIKVLVRDQLLYFLLYVPPDLYLKLTPMALDLLSS